jgi:hypothetical protein
VATERLASRRSVCSGTGPSWRVGRSSWRDVSCQRPRTVPTSLVAMPVPVARSARASWSAT